MRDTNQRHAYTGRGGGGEGVTYYICDHTVCSQSHREKKKAFANSDLGSIIDYHNQTDDGWEVGGGDDDHPVARVARSGKSTQPLTAHVIRPVGTSTRVFSGQTTWKKSFVCLLLRPVPSNTRRNYRNCHLRGRWSQCSRTSRQR